MWRRIRPTRAGHRTSSGFVCLYSAGSTITGPSVPITWGIMGYLLSTCTTSLLRTQGKRPREALAEFSSSTSLSFSITGTLHCAVSIPTAMDSLFCCVFSSPSHEVFALRHIMHECS